MRVIQNLKYNSSAKPTYKKTQSPSNRTTLPTTTRETDVYAS